MSDSINNHPLREVHGIENKGEDSLPKAVKKPAIGQSQKSIGKLHEETEAQEIARLKQETLSIIDRIQGDITLSSGETYTENSKDWNDWKQKKKNQISTGKLVWLRGFKEFLEKTYGANLAPIGSEPKPLDTTSHTHVESSEGGDSPIGGNEIPGDQQVSEPKGEPKPLDTTSHTHVESSEGGDSPIGGNEIPGDQQVSEPKGEPKPLDTTSHTHVESSEGGNSPIGGHELPGDQQVSEAKPEENISNSITEYKAEPNDDLWSIVRKFFPKLKSNAEINTKVNEIVKLNNIANRDQILKGQVLKLPRSGTLKPEAKPATNPEAKPEENISNSITEYKAEPNDDLWSIVRKFFPKLKSNAEINTKVNEIVKLNNIANRDQILKGQVIKLR